MKKISALLLAVFMMIPCFVFASCEKTPETTVSVTVLDYDEKEMYKGDVTLKIKNPTVFAALEQLAINNDFELVLSEDGTSIEEIAGKKKAPASDNGVAVGSYYWAFSKNDVSDEDKDENGNIILKGGSVEPIANGDKIVFKYSYVSLDDEK